jgi:hypothetical protein
MGSQINIEFIQGPRGYDVLLTIYEAREIIVVKFIAIPFTLFLHIHVTSFC